MMHNNIFDLLDESDELLRHKYQLIYPIGDPKPVDGDHLRWLVIQEVLEIVYKHAHDLTTKYPDAFECQANAKKSTWPNFRIIDAKKAKPLVDLLVSEIMKNGTQSVDVHVTTDIRQIIESCLSEPEEANSKLRDLPAPSQRQAILVIRGLLKYGILTHAHTKRWSVDYGINSKSYRKKESAVPFRAKDTASERTEFGHPDVAIVLTHLSYYCQGLSREQMQNAFERLRKENDPKHFYEQWVALDRKPVEQAGLLSYDTINLNDSSQMVQLHEIFCKNIRTVNYWVSRAVMPKETRQFPNKLAANSWDLAIETEHPVRGFSGTKDSKLLLPLSVVQCEIAELSGTDGEVIAKLLQPENQEYHSVPKAATSEDILKQMLKCNKKGRVLIDSGAIMIDLSNKEVAQLWLELEPEVEGAVYFEENDMMTLDRFGNSLPFVLSPLAKRLKNCVIYLDDHHTRGTDLKIPVPTHAWVTLGPGLLKDKLVQACMRMRQLGYGHSVCFWAPHEVNLSMKQLHGDKDVKSREVIEWCISNTIQSTEKSLLQWASQGLTFAKRFAGQQFYKETRSGDLLAKCSVLPEVYWLSDFFGKSRVEIRSGHVATQQKIQMVEKLDKIYPENHSTKKKTEEIGAHIVKRCTTYIDSLKVFHQYLEEEQERELEQEVEEEREVLRPPAAQPFAHQQHQHLVDLIEGRIPSDWENRNSWTSFLHPLYDAISSSELGKLFDKDAWSSKIQVTKDFIDTVNAVETNSYLRPPTNLLIRWNNDQPGPVVLVSPYEANIFLKHFHQKKTTVSIHHLSPRLRSDQPDLFWKLQAPKTGNPESLGQIMIQLEIFAGSLYYSKIGLQEVSAFTGILSQDSLQDLWTTLLDKGVIDHSGWVAKDVQRIPGVPQDQWNHVANAQNRKFKHSPADFVQKLISLRQYGDGLQGSDLGRLLRIGKK